MPPKMDKEVEKAIKDIWRLLGDIEKRLKFAEDRGKILADSLTSSKDIEKLLDLHGRRMANDPAVSNKLVMREIELSEKRREAERKEIATENARILKEMNKISKEYAKETDRARLEARLATLEAMVARALAR